MNRMKEMNTIEMNKDVAITDALTTLNMISYQVAELLRIKEELEARVNALLEHPEDVQKTYTHGKFKVTLKSGYIYSLNKEEYESIGSRLPAQFDPVRKRISYDLDKRIIREAEKYASKEDLEILGSMVSKKNAKLNVKITSGV